MFNWMHSWPHNCYNIFLTVFCKRFQPNSVHWMCTFALISSSTFNWLACIRSNGFFLLFVDKTFQFAYICLILGQFAFCACSSICLSIKHIRLRTCGNTLNVNVSINSRWHAIFRWMKTILLDFNWVETKRCLLFAVVDCVSFCCAYD